MALVKQETVDQFFVQPEATKATAGSDIESSARQRLWSPSRVLRHTWTVAQVISTCLVFLTFGEQMGLIPPLALVLPSPGGSWNGLYHIPKISEPFFDTLVRRVKILESQASTSVQHTRSFCPPTTHNSDAVDNLSARISAYEARLEAINAFVEGSRPRSFSKAGDGARPIPALTSTSNGGSAGHFWRFSGSSKDINIPSLVLDDSAGLFCWETQSPQTKVGIRLSEPARITMFSVTHPHPRTLLPRSIGKTPKTLVLWGLYPNASALPTPLFLRPTSDFLEGSHSPDDFPLNSYFIHLANGSYDPFLSSRRQYFNVSPSLLSLLTLPIHTIVIEVLDNWGANSTCLYGIGIHDEI